MIGDNDGILTSFGVRRGDPNVSLYTPHMYPACQGLSIHSFLNADCFQNFARTEDLSASTRLEYYSYVCRQIEAECAYIYIYIECTCKDSQVGA